LISASWAHHQHHQHDPRDLEDDDADGRSDHGADRTVLVEMVGRLVEHEQPRLLA
jgi:hypothetical protein